MLGFIAIAVPFFATVVLALVFGWIFIFAGVAQFVFKLAALESSAHLPAILLTILPLKQLKRSRHQLKSHLFGDNYSSDKFGAI